MFLKFFVVVEPFSVVSCQLRRHTDFAHPHLSLPDASSDSAKKSSQSASLKTEGQSQPSASDSRHRPAAATAAAASATSDYRAQTVLPPTATSQASGAVSPAADVAQGFAFTSRAAGLGYGNALRNLVDTDVRSVS